MKKIVIFYCFSILMFAGSSTVFAKDVDIQRVIESLNAKWNEAFNSNDISALASLYAENATIAPRNGKIIVGREKIADFFKKGIEAGIHNHTIEIVEAVGTGNFAHELGQWSANGAEKDGAKPTFGGILGIVFHMDDDNNWTIQSHIWNLRTD